MIHQHLLSFSSSALDSSPMYPKKKNISVGRNLSLYQINLAQIRLIKVNWTSYTNGLWPRKKNDSRLHAYKGLCKKNDSYINPDVFEREGFEAKRRPNFFILRKYLSILEFFKIKIIK